MTVSCHSERGSPFVIPKEVRLRNLFFIPNYNNLSPKDFSLRCATFRMTVSCHPEGKALCHSERGTIEESIFLSQSQYPIPKRFFIPLRYVQKDNPLSFRRSPPVIPKKARLRNLFRAVRFFIPLRYIQNDNPLSFRKRYD